MAERHHVVVDGSNLATEGRSLPSLRQLDEAVQAYAREDPEAEIIVVVDASFEHRIDPAEREQLTDAELHGEVVSPPAGAIGRGDAFVLRIAERTGATVLSNDSFQEFHAEHPWLFDEGRLMGGKPVPGVGWIFTPRVPVRGSKTRQPATGGRGADAAQSAPMKAAELAKAAQKVVAKRAATLPDGSKPEVGTVWPAKVPAAKSAAGKTAPAKGAQAKSASANGPATRSTAKAAVAKKAKKAHDEVGPQVLEITAKKADKAKPSKRAEAKKAEAKKEEASKKAQKAKKAEDAKRAEEAQKVQKADKAKSSKKAESTKKTKKAESSKSTATKAKKVSKKVKAKTKGKAGAVTVPEGSRWEAHDASLRKAIDDATVEVMSSPTETPRESKTATARRRRRSAPPPPAVNEPLAFINFAASYPLGTEVEGEVASFTSHGAMVEVPVPGGGSLYCYIPLTGLGDPPPRKAREVLSRGEHREFVLVGLDPPRRVAELALPGVARVPVDGRASQG